MRERTCQKWAEFPIGCDPTVWSLLIPGQGFRETMTRLLSHDGSHALGVIPWLQQMIIGVFTQPDVFDACGRLPWHCMQRQQEEQMKDDRVG